MYFASVLPLFHKRSVREVPLHFKTRWDIMRCARKRENAFERKGTHGGQKLYCKKRSQYKLETKGSCRGESL